VVQNKLVEISSRIDGSPGGIALFTHDISL